jgi:hypothetical protein
MAPYTHAIEEISDFSAFKTINQNSKDQIFFDDGPLNFSFSTNNSIKKRGPLNTESGREGFELPRINKTSTKFEFHYDETRQNFYISE